MLNVAIYFRYSSSLEQQKQNSEKRQRIELLEKALGKGWNIVWNNGDKETSGDKTKPKLEELKGKVKSGNVKIDILLVSSFDRLTRRDSLEFAEDVAWIRKANAKLCILDNGDELIDLNDNQKLLLLQMKVFAGNQFLKDLANKTASGQTARFKRGILGYSNVPFGFDRNGDGIVANSDMEIVKKVFSKFCETHIIADCIPLLRKSDKYKDTEKGVNVGAIKRILRHPLYIGKRVWGVEGCGDHFQVKGVKTGTGIHQNRLVEASNTLDTSESIGKFVDEALWHKANKILDHNKELFGKGKRVKDRRSTYKYSGFVRCSCGKNLVGLTNPKGSKSYRCPSAKLGYTDCGKTGSKSLREEEIDSICRYVRQELQKDESFHRQNFEKYCEWLKKKKISSKSDGASDLEELEIKKKKLKAMSEALLETPGAFPSQAMLDILQEKNQEILYEEERLQEEAEDGSEIEELFQGAKRFEDGNLQTRLDHIRKYADKAIVNPEDKEIVFNEYFGLLKMMIKDGDLAPVYINGMVISFKKGTDGISRKRNIPRLIKVDIGQMADTMEISGAKVQVSIRLYVTTITAFKALLFVRK